MRFSRSRRGRRGPRDVWIRGFDRVVDGTVWIVAVWHARRLPEPPNDATAAPPLEGDDPVSVERREEPQLHMIWPPVATEVAVAVPRGYALRAHAPGDEACFLRLMAHGEFGPWDEAKLRENVAKVIPGGWFFAVEERTGAAVATVMCLHDYTGRYPFSGDVGWLACDPAHRGRGLGAALTAAATRRFLAAGYRSIQLHTEAYRLAAVRSYLKVGFLPVVDGPESWSTWAEVCRQVGWPFHPDRWRAGTVGEPQEPRARR